MPRNRTWRERCAVYTVTVHCDFVPTSPWGWPNTFGWGTVYARNLSLMEARAIAMGFNKSAMQKRAAAVEKWDRQWAIAASCVRNRWLDRFEDVPERPQLGVTPRRTSYTPEEVERLLAACDRAKSPSADETSPGQWWRTLIATILETGLRVDKAVESAKLTQWTHGTTALHVAFRRLCRLADVRDNNGFHGLRLAYLINCESQKGGAA